MPSKIAFVAADTQRAHKLKDELCAIYGQAALDVAEVVVALGGDGFMLQTLNKLQETGLPVYGMNCGTIGFLMNRFRAKDLPARLGVAEEVALYPLRMRAETIDGKICEALAINEVSILRAGPQAAKLRIHVDDKERMPELVCDGALLATPAGSTAYNYSAHGPILPTGSGVLALTAVAAFRPRRWQGAILPASAKVHFEILEPDKRPAMADADSRSVRNVVHVEIESEKKLFHRILFDPGHGLEERLIREQFL